VDPYGYIVYPYIGPVLVKELTSQQVAERLAQGLKDGDYYRLVALSVSFVSSKEQYVYVLGEVKKPGPVPMIGSSISLLEALGRADGVTYDAEKSTVLWMRPRQSPPGVARVNLAALGDAAVSDPKIPNLQLSAGDIVYVPDSSIASFQRFMNRMFDILRPVVTLESAIALYDTAERVLSGRYPPAGTNQTFVVLPPGGSAK
jgi:polysaccharide export outer membrane protein